MQVGDVVEITRGPLGAYYSPDEDAWPMKFQDTVPAGARGEIVSKHSLEGWWVLRVYSDEGGNRFVPVAEHHVIAPR